MNESISVYNRYMVKKTNIASLPNLLIKIPTYIHEINYTPSGILFTIRNQGDVLSRYFVPQQALYFVLEIIDNPEYDNMAGRKIGF